MKLFLFLWLHLFSVLNLNVQIKQNITLLNLKFIRINKILNFRHINYLLYAQSNPSNSVITINSDIDNISEEKSIQPNLFAMDDCVTEVGIALNAGPFYVRGKIEDNALTKSLSSEERNGSIKVYSDPPGADIKIDNESYGQAPKIIRRLSIGEHQLILELDGYESYVKTIKIYLKRIISINAKLEKLAFLNIRSNPAEVDIYIDGKYYGKTPKLLNSFSKGVYNLSLRKEGYREFNQKIDITSNKIITIEGNLVKQMGGIKFTLHPRESMIILNSNTLVADQEELNLPTGEYSIEVSHPGYESKSVDINIENNIVTDLNISLQRKTLSKAILRSLFLPGWGQAYQGKTTRTWLYPLSFAGCGVGAIYFTQQYNTIVEEYNEIRNQYLSVQDEDEINRLRNEMDTKYDKVNSTETYRNIFYLSTAAIWLWNILDTVLLPPTWEKNVTVSALNDKAGIWVRLSVHL